MELLKGLNKNQRAAVCHAKGPVLVAAGAGTGKTKVITHRIAHLIKAGVSPKNILAVTFTNRATKEMAGRIKNLLNRTSQNLPAIGTFHSVAANILKKYGDCINLPSPFSILDENESSEIVKSCLGELNLDPRQFQPSAIKNIISREKSRFYESKGEAGKDFFPKTIEEILKKYNGHLKKQRALDFDDLIQKTILLFEKKPEILEIYRKKWPYLHIDEYQDTDNNQYRLVSLLAKPDGNICAVGDEDQSIYGFRGADFTNILDFEKTWPETKIISLEKNYRSTGKILEAANNVISKNKRRRGKNLFTQEKIGEKLEAFEARDERHEADIIAQKIKQLIKKGSEPSIAILCRTNFQFFLLEKAFFENSVPFQAGTTQDDFIEEKIPVRLMTVHSAKGLEFDYVFIPGLEKGLFPHFAGDKEEERRLFYVALTRAREKVFLSFCRYRHAFGSKQINQPSQFLSDIPQNLIKWK